MAKFNLPFVKDLGLQRKVMDALPYAVVGGSYEASFTNPLDMDSFKTILSHIVPAGQQLKILFLRIYTSETGGAHFRITQTNPAAGATGYPVVGAVPDGVRDYPKLEAAGAEVLRGSLRDPVHVLEGSITFDILGATPTPATAASYTLVYWGVQKIPV